MDTGGNFPRGRCIVACLPVPGYNIITFRPNSTPKETSREFYRRSFEQSFMDVLGGLTILFPGDFIALNVKVEPSTSSWFVTSILRVICAGDW